MIKNKEILLYFVILLVIFYFIISIIFGFYKKNTYSGTVFLGSSTKATVKGNDIKVYNEDTEIKKQDVKLFYKNDFIDAYIVSSESDDTIVKNVLSAYDTKDTLLFPDIFIAHTKDLSLKVKTSNLNRGRNLVEVNNFAKTNNITLQDSVRLDYIIINNLDIDDDGVEDYIYSVGLRSLTKYDSFVFLKKDNKYILIDRIESDMNTVNIKKLYYSVLIDFNNDNNYEFVVSKMMSEYGPTYSEVYSFDGTEFTKIGGE